MYPCVFSVLIVGLFQGQQCITFYFLIMTSSLTSQLLRDLSALLASNQFTSASGSNSQQCKQYPNRNTHILFVLAHTDMHTNTAEPNYAHAHTHTHAHTLQEMCANEQNTNMNADKHHMLLQLV